MLRKTLCEGNEIGSKESWMNARLVSLRKVARSNANHIEMELAKLAEQEIWLKAKLKLQEAAIDWTSPRRLCYKISKPPRCW